LFSVLATIFPVFALLFCGWLARKKNWLGASATSELNKFVVNLALPALLFDIVANARLVDLMQPDFLILFVGSTVVIFALTVGILAVRGRKFAAATMGGLNSSYANTGFMGFPLVLAIAGDEARPLILIAALVTVCVLFAMAIVMMEFAGNKANPGSSAPLSVVWRVLRNPLVFVPLVALVFPLTYSTLPSTVNSALALLGDAAAPCALVTIGLFIGDRPLKQLRLSKLNVTLVMTKLIVHPAIVLMLAWLFLNEVSELVINSAILLAALPTGTGPFMLAEYYKEDASVASDCILLSTAISPLSLAGIMLYFG